MTPAVFLSHAWIDQSAGRALENPRRALAPRLRGELQDRGIEVFYDESDIEDLEDIEERVRDGMASASLFLAWYSDGYAGRRACQWELTAAYAADPSRVAAVNPEAKIDHIRPASLHRYRIATVPDAADEQAWETLADRIVARANAASGTFIAINQELAVPRYGDPPIRSHRFVGRAESTWALDGLLRPPPPIAGGTARPATVVVSGLPGVGKSALVAEYAGRFATAYPGGIYWLRIGPMAPGVGPAAHLEAAVDGQLALLASELAPRPADIDSIQDPRQIVREHLEGLHRRFLWVVDDVPVGLTAQELKTLLPPGGEGIAVLTTQSSTYHHAPNLTLDVMSKSEAVELLIGPTKGDEALRDAHLLASRLDRLPMALEVVSSLLKLPGTSAGSLLTEFGGPGSELDLVEEAAGSPSASLSATGHTLSAAETFGPSISRLDGAAFGLLAVAAAVNVGPLPVDVLLPVATELFALDPRGSSARRAVASVQSLSLISSLESDTIEIHGLVAASTLRHIEDPETFVARCVTAISARVSDHMGDVENIASHAEYRRVASFAHALALRSAWLNHPFALSALRRVGRFLHVEMRYAEAAQIEAHAAAVADIQNVDQRETLTIRSDLALSLGHSGRRAESLDMLFALSPLFEHEFGPDDIDTMTVQHNLAAALGSTNPGRANALGISVYQRRLHVLGPDHAHTLYSMHTLLSYHVTPPGFDDPVSAYRDLIERRVRTLGINHTTTLTSMINFADRLTRMHDPEGVTLAKEVVRRRTAGYGADHPATAAARVGLLLALADQQGTTDEDIQAIVQTFSAITTGNHALVGAVASAGEVLRRSGRASSAIELLELALRLSTALSPDDESALLTAHNLVAATADAGRLDEALAQSRELVPRIVRALGSTHRLTLRARRQQALVMARLGSAEVAVPVQEELIQRWLELAGAKSAEYAEALGDLASSFAILHRFADEQRCLDLQRSTGAIDDIESAGHI